MLQRQIIYKQLQELQRRQQLQELSDARNYNNINQLSSLKPVSGAQIISADNGTRIHDSSLMFMVGNMQMMQHGASSVLQGLSNEFTLLQSQNHSIGPMGSSLLQFDGSLYGNPTPNADMNLQQWSHLQMQSNQPACMLTGNNYGPSTHPSAVGNSFVGPRCNFSSDQISMPDNAVLPSQSFDEKNLFEQVPAQDFNSEILSRNYSQLEITEQKNALLWESEGRNEIVGWHGLSPGEISKLGLSQPAASLDPLEQKILYTDENIWESSFNRSSDIDSGAFESTLESSSCMDELPSTQSGSWSALMQSAIAETSVSDSGMQEEWSGLVFQNLKSSTESQHSNFTDIVKLRNNCVDTNLQSSCTPSAANHELMLQNSNINCTAPGFDQIGQQYLKQEGFQSGASHSSSQHSPRNISQLADYNFPHKHPTGGSQQFQTPLPNVWPSEQKEHQHIMLSQLDRSGHKLRNNTWLHGSTQSGIQKPLDQVKQVNSYRYSIESEKMASGDNNEPIPALLRTCSDHCSQSMAARTREHIPDLLNKDNAAVDHTPGMQSNENMSTSGQLFQTESSAAYFAKPCDSHHVSPDPRSPQPFFLSLSMGNSSSTSPVFEGQNQFTPPKSSHAAASLPMNSAATFLHNSRLKNSHSSDPDNSVLDNELVTQLSMSDMATLQHVPSSKPPLYSNLFQSLDSEPSSLETNSGVPNQLLNLSSSKQISAFSGSSDYHEKPLEKGSSIQEYSTEISNSINGSLMTIPYQQLSNTLELVDYENPSLDSDTKDPVHSWGQNYSLAHQVHSFRHATTDCGVLVNYDGFNYPLTVENAKDLFLSGQRAGVKYNSENDVHEVSQFNFLDQKGRILQEAQRDQLGKTSIHNFQQMEEFGQKDDRNFSIISNVASNATHPSQINLQLVPTDVPNAAVNTAQLSGTTLESSTWPSTVATLIDNRKSPPVTLLSDENVTVLTRQKQKTVVFDIVPWHKEANCDISRLQHVSMSELEWAEASKRRCEEVKSEADIVEDVLPLVRAKRRLAFTAQLMQQVFRPAPAGILSADANSNVDDAAYFAARLGLADACCMTSNSHIPSQGNGLPLDKLKTSKRTNAYDLSEVMDGLIKRVKKLEGNLLRMDKNLSFADIKLESQELEKFSIINRFAKFHIKAQSSTTDPAASSGTLTVRKTYPERYVVGLAMPKTVPEGTNCHSL